MLIASDTALKRTTRRQCRFAGTAKSKRRRHYRRRRPSINAPSASRLSDAGWGIGGANAPAVQLTKSVSSLPDIPPVLKSPNTSVSNPGELNQELPAEEHGRGEFSPQRRYFEGQPSIRRHPQSVGESPPPRRCGIAKADLQGYPLDAAPASAGTVRSPPLATRWTRRRGTRRRATAPSHWT